jgi:nicotinamide mononucleotide adenylyltransferase
LPVNELARRSAERMNSNSDFQKIKKITDALAEMHRAKLRIIPLKWDEYEKWRKLHEPDIKVISGNASGSQVNMQAENNQYDKQWIQNDEYEKEINSKWLENIAGDMYIREAFLVLSDLINLQKPSFKN